MQDHMVQFQLITVRLSFFIALRAVILSMPVKLRTIILDVIEKDFKVIWKFLESEEESGNNE